MTEREHAEALLKFSGYKPPFRRTVIRRYHFCSRAYYRDADGESFFLIMSHQRAERLRNEG